MLGDDVAIFPLYFDYMKFFLNSSTTKTQHSFRMNGIWLLCNEYIDTGNAVSTVVSDELQPIKMCTPEGIRVRKGNTDYSILGQPVKTY